MGNWDIQVPVKNLAVMALLAWQIVAVASEPGVEQGKDLAFERSTVSRMASCPETLVRRCWR